MSAKDTDHGRVRIVCSTARESGSCSNKRALYLDEIEGRVIAGMQQRLKDERYFRSFLDGYNEELRRLTAGDGDERRLIEQRKRAADVAFENLLDLVTKGVVSSEDVKHRFGVLNLERAELDQRLKLLSSGEGELKLDQPSLAAYRQHVGSILTHSSPVHESEAWKAVREPIDSVVVAPGAAEKPEIDVYGRLSALVSGQKGDASGGKVVAEEGCATNTSETPGNHSLR